MSNTSSVCMILQDFSSFNLAQFYAEPVRVSNLVKTHQTQLLEHSISSPNHFLTIFQTLHSSTPSSPSTTTTTPLSSSFVLPSIPSNLKSISSFNSAWNQLHVLERHQSLLTSWLQLPSLCQEAIQDASNWETGMYLLSQLDRWWQLLPPSFSSSSNSSSSSCVSLSIPILSYQILHACFDVVKKKWIPELKHNLSDQDQVAELITSLRYLKKVDVLVDRFNQFQLLSMVKQPFLIQGPSPSPSPSLLVTNTQPHPTCLTPAYDELEKELQWCSLFLSKHRRHCSLDSFDPTVPYWLSMLNRLQHHLNVLVPTFHTLFPKESWTSLLTNATKVSSTMEKTMEDPIRMMCPSLLLLDTLYTCLNTFLQEHHKDPRFQLEKSSDLMPLVRRCQEVGQSLLPWGLNLTPWLFTFWLDPWLLKYVKTQFQLLLASSTQVSSGPTKSFSHKQPLNETKQEQKKKKEGHSQVSQKEEEEEEVHPLVHKVITSLEWVTTVYVPISKISDLANELRYLCQFHPMLRSIQVRQPILNYWKTFLDQLEQQTWEEEFIQDGTSNLKKIHSFSVGAKKLYIHRESLEIE